MPSCAVTSVVIVLSPRSSAKAPLATPDTTAVVLTLIVAFPSAAVGVTVKLVVSKGTLAS